MATASHAAGLELRQTVWVMQAVEEDGQWENTALEGFEHYRLVSTVTAERSHIIPGCMRANRAMSQLLTEGTPLQSADVLSDELVQKLRDGMCFVDGCLVLGKSDAAPRLNSIRAAVMDKTGYECFVNHVHLKERGDSAAVLRQAVAFCRRVSVEALRLAPNQSLRFIISKNGEDWTAHFHILRTDEPSWVSDDLEGYKEEAVLVLDSTELGAATS
jgi:hypothetical protein